MSTNTEKVLTYATRLAYRDILKRSLEMNPLWYERTSNSELKFIVNPIDYVDDKEVAEILVKVFKKHGFDATYEENNGEDEIYLYVKVGSFLDEIEERIEECFNDDEE
jgi:hypothetical protein